MATQNLLLTAALAHYIAKRDKALAELSLYLNNPVGVGEHATVVDEVIELFSKLENADSVIRTVNEIVIGNQQIERAPTVEDLKTSLAAVMKEKDENVQPKVEPIPLSTDPETQNVQSK